MHPAQILAISLGACAVIATFAAALTYVLPALGTAASLAFTGAAAGFTLAPALGTAMAYGTAALGGAAAIHLTVHLVTRAQTQPLAWGAPILALVSGYLVQSCEKYWTGPELGWPLFALAVGALVLVGGVLYAGGSWLHRITGCLLSLIPPVVVLVLARDRNGVSLVSNLGALPLDIIVPVGVMLVVALALGVVAHLDHQQRRR